MTGFTRFVPSRLFGFAAALAFGVLVSTPSDARTDADAGWIKTREEDGIRVSRKEIAGSSFLALRGEGDINEPPLLIGSVLVDVGRSHEWVDSVVDARVLRAVNGSEYVSYAHVATPITMADRDFVTDVRIEIDPVAKRIVIRAHSVSDPLAPKTSYVRGEVEESVLVLTSVDGGARTHVVAEVHADPKGGIAAWLVNLFQKNWGYNTLEHLRTQAAKADVQVDPRLRALLDAQGYFGAPVASVGPDGLDGR